MNFSKCTPNGTSTLARASLVCKTLLVCELNLLHKNYNKIHSFISSLRKISYCTWKFRSQAILLRQLVLLPDYLRSKTFDITHRIITWSFLLVLGCQAIKDSESPYEFNIPPDMSKISFPCCSLVCFLVFCSVLNRQYRFTAGIVNLWKRNSSFIFGWWSEA